MNQQTVYHFYDPNTFEYQGGMAASGKAGAAPPEYSTTDSPENRSGYAAFRDVAGNAWIYVEDHRGETVFAKDLSGVMQIESVGAVPDDFTLLPPPELKNGWQIEWKQDQWAYTEDHRGATGYVDGEEVTIEDLGPLPDGWSAEPPPPPPSLRRMCRRRTRGRRRRSAKRHTGRKPIRLPGGLTATASRRRRGG